MKEQIFLSLVIPAYNEETRISNTLLDLDRYLSRQKYTYEIIVVNDGSKDNTAQVVEKFTGLVSHLRLISNSQNHGKGYVVRQGMLAAEGQYRLFIDADNAIAIDHLDAFWPHLKQDYDIIIGSVEVSGAKAEEKGAGYRRILGKLSKYLIRALTVWEIHDSQRAFKLFPAEAAERIFSRQTIERWGFDIEILAIAKKLGLRIKELPVAWINPTGSKITFGSYLKTLKELVKIKWNLIRGKYA